MAFNRDRWSRQTLAFNTGLVVTDGPTLENGPALFTYASATDNIAAIGGANYFAPAVFDLAVGDFILATGSDASNILRVTAVNRELETITTESFTTAGVVGTANIQDGAVTSAKLAAATAGSGLTGGAGSPLAVNVDDSTIEVDTDVVQVKDAGITSAKLAANTIQYAQVTMSAADWNGMYATPKQLVAAPGANLQISVHAIRIFLDYNSAQFAGGGNVFAQFDSTANGAGTQATGVIANTGINAAVADSTIQLAGIQTVAAASTTVNKGLYLSNASGAFTTGNSTFKVDVWYSITSYA